MPLDHDRGYSSRVMSDAFFAYAVTSLILCLNLTVLWALSGGARVKSKTTHNSEDAATFAKGSEVSSEVPDGVARVLRVHNNALANTVPFLFLGQLYVTAGASSTMAWVFFGTFAASRVFHSVSYLAQLQPWRTLTFGVGLLSTFGLMIHLAMLLVG